MKIHLWLCLILASLLGTLRIAQGADTDSNPTYSVDFSKQVGKIRPLNGINLWVKFSTASIANSQADAEACHFSTIRLHDAPWDNGGMRLVDVHQIFGNLKADPANPDNYFFGPTDDYIAAIRKGGAVPIYRLGTSIEHTETKYFAKKPEDFEHYAEICAAIVRHYNANWANGYEWDLPYWEIWNEPNLVPQMWDDYDWDSYCQFYVTVAKRLRAEFPNIKIGGPGLTHAGYDLIGHLAEICKKENAPLDFVSWHCYAKTPDEVLQPPYEMRKMLDKLGFPNTELHLNEWHYFPTDWSVVHGVNGGSEAKRELSVSPEGLHGAESAAFIDYVLTRWQDGPLDMSNYYAMGLDTWGLTDVYGKLRPTYYAFLLFGEMVDAAPIRVETSASDENVSLLGGVDKSNQTRLLLVSVFKRGKSGKISIKIDGAEQSGEVEVSKINYDVDYDIEKISYSNGILTLDAPKSSVFLIRF